jgi:excisionase family DNA binding protein
MMTLSQAAAALGVSAATLRQQVAAGRLRATKIGPLWVVAETEVERYRRDSLGKAGRPPKRRRRS